MKRKKPPKLKRSKPFYLWAARKPNGQWVRYVGGEIMAAVNRREAMSMDRLADGERFVRVKCVELPAPSRRKIGRKR